MQPRDRGLEPGPEHRIAAGELEPGQELIAEERVAAHVDAEARSEQYAIDHPGRAITQRQLDRVAIEPGLDHGAPARDRHVEEPRLQPAGAGGPDAAVGDR